MRVWREPDPTARSSRLPHRSVRSYNPSVPRNAEVIRQWTILREIERSRGAGVTIDRGANRDTVIGEGAKIDNLVQIGHNVLVGRHAVLVAQSGVSGSSAIGDFAALGGQAGIAGHLTIGAGAQVAAAAGVMTDVPAGERWAGAPAKPVREFFREVAAIKRLAAGGARGETNAE